MVAAEPSGRLLFWLKEVRGMIVGSRLHEKNGDVLEEPRSIAIVLDLIQDDLVARLGIPNRFQYIQAFDYQTILWKLGWGTSHIVAKTIIRNMTVAVAKEDAGIREKYLTPSMSRKKQTFAAVASDPVQGGRASVRLHLPPAGRRRLLGRLRSVGKTMTPEQLGFTTATPWAHLRVQPGQTALFAGGWQHLAVRLGYTTATSWAHLCPASAFALPSPRPGARAGGVYAIDCPLAEAPGLEETFEEERVGE